MGKRIVAAAGKSKALTGLRQAMNDSLEDLQDLTSERVKQLDGILKASGIVTVVGLKSKLGHWLVNEYNRRVTEGERFLPDVLYLGFLEGFAVRFGPVTREYREEYMRSACWLHGGPAFEALQLIWPSTSGVWPWESEASEWFRANQPLLSGEGT